MSDDQHGSPRTAAGSVDVEDQPMAPLERRYRRWIGLFPVAYRVEREDELVGVLLDAAAPGQDRPRLAEVVDLARAAAVAHVRMGRTSPRRQQWSDASVVVGIILAVVLTTQGARFVAAAGRTSLFVDPSAVEPPLSWNALRGWYVPMAWAVVVALLALGRTRLACAAAWAAAGARLISVVETAEVPLYPGGTPGAGIGQAQTMIVQLTIGVIAAILLSRPRQVRATIDSIGRGRFAASIALFVVAIAARRWNDRWGSGVDIWVIVVPFAVALALWTSHVGLLRAHRDPVARRIGAGLFAVLVVFFVSDAATGVFGATGVVTRRDLVATFAVGIATAVGAAMLLAIAPVAARRFPFRVVRRSTTDATSCR